MTKIKHTGHGATRPLTHALKIKAVYRIYFPGRRVLSYFPSLYQLKFQNVVGQVTHTVSEINGNIGRKHTENWLPNL